MTSGLRMVVGRWLAHAILLACSVAPGLANAQWQGGHWYVGGGAGYLSADPDASAFSAFAITCAPTACTMDAEEDSHSFTFFGGY